MRIINSLPCQTYPCCTHSNFIQTMRHGLRAKKDRLHLDYRSVYECGRDARGWDACGQDSIGTVDEALCPLLSYSFPFSLTELSGEWRPSNSRQRSALGILDIGVGVPCKLWLLGVMRPFEEMDSQHCLVLHNKYKLTVFISWEHAQHEGSSDVLRPNQERTKLLMFGSAIERTAI